MAVGFSVLAGILIYRSFASSASSLKHELAYLPADCRTIGYYRLGDASRSPFFQDHLTRAPQVRISVDQFRDRTGMELSEVESVVLGLKVPDPSRLNALGMMGQTQGMKFVAVARAAKDWDRERLIGKHSESATHNNHTYHTYLPEPLSQERWAFYLADARTLIFGTIDEVQAAIDTQGQIPDWPDVDFLQPDFPILNASVAGSSSFYPVPPLPMPMPANARSQGAGLMLTSENVRQVTFLRFENAGDAAKFVGTSEEAEENRQRVQQAPGFRPAGGPAVMTFTQHGLTVAVSNGGVGSVAGPMLTQAISPPLALLARLGLLLFFMMVRSGFPADGQDR
jgi:hypothetical protein